MSKCSNCGAVVEIGMKFCGECGTPIPQVKKCINCGTELPIKMKFCFECGTPQGNPSSFGLGTSVSMGDKNVIAGDVVGQKVVGDNVQSKIMGNAFYNTFQDDTKRVNSCHVCGKHLTNVDGHTCPGCGNVVCIDHFDLGKKLCLKCIAAEKEKNVAKYKEALQNVLADGVIDFNERAMLKRLQLQLGLSDNDADSLERAAKSSKMQLADSLTTIESINLRNAEELFYENGEIEKAFQIVEPIYNAHPFEEKILNLYLPILVQYDIEKAKQTIQSIKVDCLALCIAEIEIALQEKRLDVVEKKVRQGKTLWPDNGILKYYAALLYIRLAFVSGEWGCIQDAKNVAETFTETNNKVERTLQAKMRKYLAVLDGKPSEYADDILQDLYKTLYLRYFGISEISVGNKNRIKSIQQAINLLDAGGIVIVEPGLYKEHLDFSKCFKLVGARSSILNKSSNSLPIIVLDSAKTCKLSNVVEIEGVVFTHNENLIFDNLNDYARSEKQFEDGHAYFNYGDDGWNSLLLVESDSVLSNVAILDSENYGITFSKNSAKVMDSVVSRCRGIGVCCVENSNAVISSSMISRSEYPGIVVNNDSKPTITSCEIYDNNYSGVDIQGAASGVFKNCHIHDNKGNGFHIFDDSTPTIENCDVHDNRTEGGDWLGVWVENNAKPIICGCKIYGHLACGIWEKDNACGTYLDCDIYDNIYGACILDSASGAFRNCLVHDNDGYGFCIDGESTPKIEFCKIHDNKTGDYSHGVAVQNNSKPTITGCEIFGHLNHGVWEKDNACGIYLDCDIHDNCSEGVCFQDSASGSFRNCDVHDNMESGFRINGNSTPKIEKCKIHDNKSGEYSSRGVVVLDNSKPTIIDCEIFGHYGAGIRERDHAYGTYVNCNIHNNWGLNISREH